MSTYERIADLPLEIDGYTLEGHSKTVSSGFERRTTVIRLQGGGEEGLGEDVTYDGDNQIDQQAHGPVLPLDRRLDRRVVLRAHRRARHVPGRPAEDARVPATTAAGRSRARRWTSRCARPAARSPTSSSASPRPVTFVVSSRMGEPPTLDPVTRRLARYPDLRFKLDGTPDWSDELIAGLVETGAVDSIDFKGAYKGTVVDVDTDPAFYKRIAETFPDAWLEDPDLEDEAAREALRPYEDRITWDAPIHSIDDILAQRVLPKTVNLKPSRFGSIEALFAAYDFCEERGMGAYGGGQYELVRRPRPDPVPGGDLPRRRAQRHRPRGLRRARSRARPPRQPARARDSSPPGSAGGRRLDPCLRSSDRCASSPSRLSRRCRSSRPAATRSWRPRRATAPPPRRCSAPAPRSAWTPSARASTSAPRSRPRARRSACSCAGWRRPRWRSPSAARATSRSRPRSSGRRRRPTASCCCCASWA